MAEGGEMITHYGDKIILVGDDPEGGTMRYTLVVNAETWQVYDGEVNPANLVCQGNHSQNPIEAILLLEGK